MPAKFPRETDRVFGKMGAPLAKGSKNTAGSEFGSYHPGICQFVLADGNVRPISVSISLTTLARLANRQDGQVVSKF